MTLNRYQFWLKTVIIYPEQKNNNCRHLNRKSKSKFYVKTAVLKMFQ